MDRDSDGWQWANHGIVHGSGEHRWVSQSRAIRRRCGSTECERNGESDHGNWSEQWHFVYLYGDGQQRRKESVHSSAASNSVTPSTRPAGSYTLTGPTGGSLNTASTIFTVTPNGLYTWGTITITPVGWRVFLRLSVLTFSNSPHAAETFSDHAGKRWGR